MHQYNYTIHTIGGYATGSIEAKSETDAREQLAKNHAGELHDTDGKPFNNDVESIDLIEIIPSSQE